MWVWLIVVGVGMWAGILAGYGWGRVTGIATGKRLVNKLLTLYRTGSLLRAPDGDTVFCGLPLGGEVMIIADADTQARRGIIHALACEPCAGAPTPDGVQHPWHTYLQGGKMTVTIKLESL